VFLTLVVVLVEAQPPTTNTGLEQFIATMGHDHVAMLQYSSTETITATTTARLQQHLCILANIPLELETVPELASARAAAAALAPYCPAVVHLLQAYLQVGMLQHQTHQ
jgi:hypothetical protein